LIDTLISQTQPLFRAETLPGWYEAAYQSLAVEGTRVLALGHKVMDAGEAAGGEEEDRGKVEQGLAFAGLAAFSTQIRADSRRVIRQLTDAGE
jgi:magnesium-transporting ATPase (P-type)